MDKGVSPSGSGCQPTASAADASSQSDIPNAENNSSPESVLRFYVGRKPQVCKHTARNRAFMKRVTDRLDAAGDHEAADIIAWAAWWNDLDNERERYLQAQTIEARRAETGTGSVHESVVGETDAPEGGA